jgi:hypothetical protein
LNACDIIASDFPSPESGILALDSYHAAHLIGLIHVLAFHAIWPHTRPYDWHLKGLVEIFAIALRFVLFSDFGSCNLI